jgi:hypothetical protein
MLYAVDLFSQANIIYFAISHNPAAPSVSAGCRVTDCYVMPSSVAISIGQTIVKCQMFDCCIDYELISVERSEIAYFLEATSVSFHVT